MQVGERKAAVRDEQPVGKEQRARRVRESGAPPACRRARSTRARGWRSGSRRSPTATRSRRSATPSYDSASSWLPAITQTRCRAPRRSARTRAAGPRAPKPSSSKKSPRKTMRGAAPSLGAASRRSSASAASSASRSPCRSPMIQSGLAASSARHRIARSSASRAVAVEQQARAAGAVEQRLHALDGRAHARADRRRVDRARGPPAQSRSSHVHDGQSPAGGGPRRRAGERGSAALGRGCVESSARDRLAVGRLVGTPSTASGSAASVGALAAASAASGASARPDGVGARSARTRTVSGSLTMPLACAADGDHVALRGARAAR